MLQECVSDHCHERMTVEAVPGPSLEVVKAELFFYLLNRVFKSYDDLVDHCCEAWNKLVDQPWRIRSIGLRQWVHGF